MLPRLAVALALLVVPRCAYATLLAPDWFTTDNLVLEFNGSLGGSDVDRIEPSRQPVSSGLEPNREFFALVTGDAAGQGLSWFKDYDLATDTFLGLLDSSETTSPSFQAAILGAVNDAGNINLCIGPPDCDRTGSAPPSTYHFALAVKPLAVPEPGTLPLLALGVVGLALLAVRRRGEPVNPGSATPRQGSKLAHLGGILRRRSGPKTRRKLGFFSHTRRVP